MTEKPDLQQCESCTKEYPIQSMQMMEDNWICEDCYVEWKAEFDSCAHRWKPHTGTMSEPGRICERCSGFMADEDAAIVGV